METIENLRGGRRLICVCNFDRAETPQLGALSTQYQEDIKEPLYRVLKETLRRGQKLDLFLYTRGGALDAVWPVASLLREFDEEFEVLIPFRAHSSGTLLALAARRIFMTPLGELSPIDPTTANQFNPQDPVNSSKRLGIAVEDLNAYREFWKTAYGLGENEIAAEERIQILQPHMEALTAKLHPLALGGVHRVHLQVRLLAKMLLEKHYGTGDKIKTIVDQLTTQYYSHTHMVNRHEARKILGHEHVEFASARLTRALDRLLRKFEEDFKLRHPFFLARFLGDDAEKDARFIGGAIESRKWAYLYETMMKVRQFLAPPQGVSIQVPPGQSPPLVPGVPRHHELQPLSRGWVRNTRPKGVTV